jgi:AbrB family looped-hinge helix DNA binding protein
MATATISEKGWIVIPAEMRKKYDLRPGAQVMLVDYGGVLAIVPALKDPVKDSAGLLKGGRSLIAALKQERAREQAREEARGRRRGR